MPLFTPVVAPHPGYVAGRWYSPVPGCLYAAGAVLANGSVKLLPMPILAPVTISDLAVHITTLAAGGNVRAAIYNSDPVTHLPTTVVAQTGNIATDSAVPVSADITGSNVSLQPGWYWQAVNADNATVVLKTLSTAAVWAQGSIGSTTLNTAVGSLSGSEARFGISFASAFGSFPDLTGQSLTEFVSSATGLVFFKAA